METKIPQLLPLARSTLQGDMLATLYLNPERACSLSELAMITHATVRAVHAEANRLVAVGWLSQERVGRTRMLRAAKDGIFVRPLTDLLVVTHGPLPLLTAALANVGGIEHAYIYGSWAARHQGIAGPPPNDIDVLVVGGADPDALRRAVEPAQLRLRREVNIRRVSQERWANPGDDPFLASVRSRPLVPIASSGKSS